MSGRTRNIIRNINSGIVNRVLIMVFEFAIRALIIQRLGVEYLGLGSLFSSILQMLNLAELGFGGAVVYSMYKPIADHDEDKICALLNLYRKIYHVVGFVILGMGLGLCPFLEFLISGSYPEEVNIYVLYLIYLANTVIGYFLFAYRASLFIAHQRDDIRLNIQIVMKLLMYILQIGVLLWFKNYYLYVILLPICTICTNLATYYVSVARYPQYVCRGKIDEDTRNNLKKKVAGLLAFQIGGVIYNNADVIVVSIFLGLSTLAKYSNYYSIMYALNAFINIFSNAMTASIGNSIATESVEKNARQFCQLSDLFAWIIGWCSICLMCLFQPFIKLWVGSENLLSTDNVLCFAIYFYFWNFNPAVAIYKNAAGIWWEDRYRVLIGIALNVLLNVWWVQVIGVNGVVLSSIVTSAFISVPCASYILFKHYLKVPLSKYLIKQAKFLAYTIIIGGITYIACMACPLGRGNSLAEFLISGLLCIFVPNILYYAVFRITGDWNNIKGYFVFLKKKKEG